MKLTTRGRYALQALMDMITNANGKAVKLLDISTRQNLPIAYLEQLFRQLRIGGVVKSVRGPGGGYVLAREPSEITLAEVFKSVQEVIELGEIIRLSDNPTPEAVMSRKALTQLDTATSKVLSQSLASLL